jgi:hypothetical protein
MATEEAAAAEFMGDKYRSFLYDEGEKSTEWRHGGPPAYDDVNKLFEEGRTKVCGWIYGWPSIFLLLSDFPPLIVARNLQEWPKGSLEEIVQNAVKSWEMELSHKTRLKDFKTINPDKFKLFVNGNKQ